MALFASPLVRPAAEVQRKLHGAADDQLAKVLALVDAMPERGAADALIAPLRPRLAAIQPVRPLSITRLLFRPLDPVIASGPRWRPGTPAVPRTALLSIGNAVIERLGAVAAPVQAMIAGQDGNEADLVAAAGTLLWPPAAAVMASLPLPADWGVTTGLPKGCYPEIRTNIAAVLQQAVLLSQRLHDPGDTDPTPVLKAILAATQATHPAGLSIVLAVLLADGATAGPVLQAALSLPTAQVEQVLDRAQHQSTTVLPSVGLAAASVQASHISALLDAIEAPGARPLLRAKAQHTRQIADEACQGRLIQALDQEFLPKLAATAAIADDAALARLEDVARGLRKLSLAGRRFGVGAMYDRLLGRTAMGACAAPDSTLTRMERLRLAEILVGPDAALRLIPA